MKELDKDARCFDKPFHLVLRDIKLDFLIPKMYNSKIEGKRRYKQIDGEHYIFMKSDEHIQIDFPVCINRQGISIVAMDMNADEYATIYGALGDSLDNELPEDLAFPMRAIAGAGAMPGYVNCQIIIPVKSNKTILMTSSVLKDELDEIMGLAEYIKPYTGEIPDSSDKEAYKANTHHPLLYLEDIEDRDESEPFADLEKYENEDHDDYDEETDPYEIIVDINSKDHIRRVINYMIACFNEYDELVIGHKVKGEFEEYQSEEVGSTFFAMNYHDSELAFFIAAVKFPELHKKIIDYIDLAVDEDVPWKDDETPKGLNAAFALALENDRYITKYIELINGADMDHEVYQLGQIDILVNKWKDYENGIKLLGARWFTASGQHGPENLSLFLERNPIYLQDNSKKEYLFKTMILFATENRDFINERTDDLLKYYVIPLLNVLEIDYDENKVEKSILLMSEMAVPGFDDLI